MNNFGEGRIYEVLSEVENKAKILYLEQAKFVKVKYEK